MSASETSHSMVLPPLTPSPGSLSSNTSTKAAYDRILDNYEIVVSRYSDFVGHFVAVAGNPSDFVLEDLGVCERDDAIAKRDVLFPTYAVTHLTGPEYQSDVFSWPPLFRPPLICEELIELFGYFCNNYSQLGTTHGRGWLRLSMIDGNVQVQKVVESMSCDDVVVSGLGHTEVIQQCSLIVPCELDKELLFGVTNKLTTSLSMHHVVDVNIKVAGGSTVVKQLMVDTGCTVTTLFDQTNFDQGHYQLHLLNIPGGNRLCLRRLDSISIGLVQFRLKPVNGITFVLNEKTTHALFSKVDLKTIKDNTGPSVLSDLFAIPEFNDWITNAQYVQPPPAVERMLRHYLVHPPAVNPTLKLDGLLGQNYLHKIRVLQEPVDDEECEKAARLTVTDLPGTFSLVFQ